MPLIRVLPSKRRPLVRVYRNEVHGKTRATWTTSQVATSASGNARVEAVTQDSHDASRTGLEVMLKYYLATGEMIDAEKLHERLEAPAHR
jgi:hypothetical protein